MEKRPKIMGVALLPRTVLFQGFIVSLAFSLVVTTSAAKTSASKDLPIILWWTGKLFFGTGINEIKCGNYKCYFTDQRQYIEDPRTRILLFYGTDVQPDDMPLPRSQRHEWALFHEESPMNNFMLSHMAMLANFNHTATFRRESDFPVTTQNIPHLKYLTSRKPVNITMKNKFQNEEGLAPILYVQSHCEVSSDRDRYVEELMKYIKVDSLGECVNNKKMPDHLSDPIESMHSKTFLKYISRYKFHLAFENAICNDYMTEKLFRTLHVGSVPVYLGSPLAKDWMPDSHSIIMARDFPSPKDLAEFISELNSDDDMYRQYLSYKDLGVSNKFLIEHIKKRQFGDDMNVNMIRGFECYLCNQASERLRNEEEHKNDPNVQLLPPKVAKHDHLYCPQPYPSIGDLDDLPTNDSWRKHWWLEDYWSSYDRAKALEEMIQQKVTDSSLFDDYWMNRVQKRINNPTIT